MQLDTGENPAYLTEQIITYIGNKRTLLPFIGQALELVKGELGRDKLALADLFSGSGIVARYFKRHAKCLFANDLEEYALVLNQCYLSNSDSRDEGALREAHRQTVDRIGQGLEEGFISRLYAPRDTENISIGERVFYTTRNAMYLDTARQAIAALPEELRLFLIAPLLTEASVKTNTSGVFKGFYKNSRTGIGQFGGNGRNALSRILADIELPFPLFSRYDCPVTALKMDAAAAAEVMPHMDLVYLDPPYNQHPYGSNYFMLNLLCDYHEPEKVSRVSGIPEDWNRSPYNKSRQALEALSSLCRRLDAEYVLISFNSEGFIAKEDMQKMLEELGEVRVFSQQYNTFRGSRNLREREIYTNEFLFLLRKGGKAVERG